MFANVGFFPQILATALVGILTIDHESCDTPLFPEWMPLVIWQLPGRSYGHCVCIRCSAT